MASPRSGNGNPNDRELDRLLARMRDGDVEAAHEVWRCMMIDLRSIARGFMGHERGSHTLQPTALVSEVYLRLFAEDPPLIVDRRHFVALARRTMRRILIDHGRHVAGRNAFWQELRDGRRRLPVELERGLSVDGLIDHLDHRQVDLVHEALDELARRHPERAEAMEMQWFGDMKVEEIAIFQGEPDTTIQGWLRFARAFVRDFIKRRMGET